MAKYYVDYQTGAGNFEFEGELEDAMREAVEGVDYTQRDVYIYDSEHNQVARLPWYGCPPPSQEEIEEYYEDFEIVEQFGDFGYYANWELD